MRAAFLNYKNTGEKIMGSNYPNQQEENYNDKNIENVTFPTEDNFETFESDYDKKPLISREVLEVPVYVKKKGNTAIIILLSVLLALLTVLLVVVIVLNNSGERNMSEKERAAVEETVDDSSDEGKNTNSFPRYSTYNSGYSYTDMPNIYYSMEADDEECFKMEDFIKDFNSAWINYVNYGDTTVYTYLRAGTKPYQYAVNYGKKNLTEEYQTMQVNDVREYNGTYYVWTYEIINKYYDGKTEQAVYHWIYKIGKDGGGYYVELYKKDPYYS